jgi:carbon-monoxide dehydrogenase medium subunit
MIEHNKSGVDMSKVKNLFRPAEYLRPGDLAEAIKLLTKYGEKARIIAGGTDVLVEKDPKIEVLIDVMGLGLDYIETDDLGVRIGAATTFAEIEASPALRMNPYNILAQAAHQIGTPQIRNLATIGGNICSAVPSADSALPLLALDATVCISGSTEERSMEVSNFFLDARKNALERDELLTEIRLPVLPARTETVFIKKGRVAAADLATVNAAVRVTISVGGICQDVRIALGAVAPTPVRVKAAESMLRGKKPQDELLEKVAEQASKEISPITDIRGSAQYRTTLSRVLVERALNEAVARLSV